MLVLCVIGPRFSLDLWQNPVLLRVIELFYCVGLSGFQPAEYSSGNRQHGFYCQAMGRGDWGGGGHSDREFSFLL